jgi:hypothetical protein
LENKKSPSKLCSELYCVKAAEEKNKQVNTTEISDLDSA